MENKKMGTFIAALRKSKGMTQQDVAEKLNVSNKTVSKWECGDGYPEIMMISAIAELFEVTADEILKGERIINNDTDTGRKKTSTDKQVKCLLNKMAVKYKNLSFLAISFILLGLICLYSISYAFYKPVIGFGVMMVLVVAGVITELIAINNIHSSYESSDMLKEKNDISMNYLKLLYRYSAFLFSTAIFTIIASLPFILVQSNFLRDSVISIGTYIRMLPFIIIVSSVIISIGRYAARKKLGKAHFPLITEQEIKMRASLNKKFIIVVLAVF